MLCPVSLGEERSRATLARVPRGTDSRGEAVFYVEPTPWGGSDVPRGTNLKSGDPVADRHVPRGTALPVEDERPTSDAGTRRRSTWNNLKRPPTGGDDATAPVSAPGRIERTSVAVATARVQPLADGQRNAGEHTVIHRTLIPTARVPARAPPGCTCSPRPIHLTLQARRYFQSAQGASPSDGDGATFARRDRSSRILVFAEIALRGGSCFSAGRSRQVMPARRSAGRKCRRGKIPAVEGERSTAASA